nr:MAG TPA: hypothetical protein [Caudoviricetes sp.]
MFVDHCPPYLAGLQGFQSFMFRIFYLNELF